MTGAWIRFAASAGFLVLGLVFMILAVFGVNRFDKALNRMHAAAMGDTLGILFVFLGLILMRGFSMDSLKLFLVILFFWTASPVSGHMISRLEVMTDEKLGELLLIHREKADGKGEQRILLTGDGRNSGHESRFSADGRPMGRQNGAQKTVGKTAGSRKENKGKRGKDR